ncbi:hypothetical protein K491DRAFT_715574 [Lophiostoma macrostomum CBS 122681]|uniref:Uncharacterized protein n=1 Tax=Lophiostoma macrostomum CBS 122681 TaxID=1314788 RepID=A0A6A6T8K9_9PLEO|nr:hypothetical protein K491DRAFT_715574 [Lophiostoma macrostomum CBS 122681]
MAFTSTTAKLQNPVFMAIFNNNKKANAAARMTSTHGSTGTAEECQFVPFTSHVLVSSSFHTHTINSLPPDRNLRPTTRPRDSNMSPDQVSYNKEFTDDPALLAKAQKFGEEHWWKGLCQSANKEPFYGILFEKEMFNNEGTLDIKLPGLSKIVQSMAIAYMHIIRKYGQDPPEGWTMHWAIKNDVGPYLDIFKASTNQRFGMSPPSTGFYDHSGELKALRKKRDSGESMAMPEPVEEQEAIGEGWGLIEEGDSDEFEEARSKVPNEDGYVYQVKDSKPARKGWFG